MEDFTDIETIALRDVYFTRTKRPGVSDDFHLRRIMREYSQKFVTPLHEVYELPVDFVVLAWMEEYYEDCKDEDLLREIQAAVKSYDQLLAERRAEDETDADSWLFGEDIRRSEQSVKKMEEAVKAIGHATSMLLTHEEQKTGMRLGKQAEVTNVAVKPGERIKMTFGPVDLEGDSFGLLDAPKP